MMKQFLQRACIAFILWVSAMQLSATIPVYVWQSWNGKTTAGTLNKDFAKWKSHGVGGVCLNAGFDVEKTRTAAKAAKALGLEYHAWAPCMLQEGLDSTWYAVNRLGQSAYTAQAYVPYYKCLDPRNPQVQEWLIDKYCRLADIPEVDYVQLDYIRYVDVILAKGLWEKYNLVMDEEYPPADYCYCDHCVQDFKAQTGIDIRSVKDPSGCREWAQFRCDAITELVNRIAAAVHAKGKKVSADVFPGPYSYATWMVRQEWNKWNVDAFFPMNYNDFYMENVAWVGRMTQEEVASVRGKAPVYSGLFICRDWKNKDKVVDPENSGLLPSEMAEAVTGSMQAGAAGICLFTPYDMTGEHWEALDKVTGNLYWGSWTDFNKNGRMDIYENPAAAMNDRIEDLLSQMTLEEKTVQMATLYGSGRVLKDALPTAAWKTEIWKDGIGNIDEEHNGLGSFGSEYANPFSRHVETLNTIQRWFVEETRLGIPVDFTNEGIRGLNHSQATLFPAQSGQGATWDKELIGRIADVTAVEAKALGYTNIYSPILDIARDPRWGRVVECYGEDPYLVGQLGKQMVTGLQKHGLVSTPKHFAVYSIPVGGRDGETRTDPHVAPREMRTLYLEPFRVAFQEAGALGVMSSYNDYDGEPITGSYRFLTEILRNEWGFKGYVVSDSEAVEYLYSKHRVVKDAVEAAALAVNAGLNIRTNFTLPENFVLPLREAVKRGLVSTKTIDDRVRDILRVKFILGLFDNPYTGNAAEADRIVASPPHKALSLRAARESVILLKNAGNILPLDRKKIGKIALIGPNADEKKNFICRYGPANPRIISVKEGLETLLPDVRIIYEKGCEIIDKNFPESEIIREPLSVDEQAAIDRAVEAARQADVAIVVLGGSEKTVRESFSRSGLDLAGRQQDLLQAVWQTGKPVILVLIDGRAVTINWANKYVPGILQASFPGEYTGTVIAEALFGDYNPGGKLAVTVPKTVGQIPFAFPFKPGADSKGAVRVSGALYPFGHGLSYTTFGYSGLKITPEKAGLLSNVEVSFNVRNTGKVAGDEVVQLYLNDEVSSVTTYTQALRGFDRIHLKPGETRELKYVLTPQDLGLWNRHDEFVVEPGIFEVRIGASSEDIRLKGKFEVER